VIKKFPLGKKNTPPRGGVSLISKGGGPVFFLCGMCAGFDPGGGGGRGNVRKDRLSDAELYLDLVVKGLSLLPCKEMTVRACISARENIEFLFRT